MKEIKCQSHDQLLPLAQTKVKNVQRSDQSRVLNLFFLIIGKELKQMEGFNTQEP